MAKKKSEPAERRVIYDCPRCGRVTKIVKFPAARDESSFQKDGQACAKCRDWPLKNDTGRPEDDDAEI